MKTRRVIVADDVRACQRAGHQRLYLGSSGCLVTPEAHDVARLLGVELCDGEAEGPPDTGAPGEAPAAPPCSRHQLDEIRQCVIDAVRGRGLSPAEIAHIVRQVAQRWAPATAANSEPVTEQSVMTLNAFILRCAQQIAQRLHGLKPRVVFPDALDERTLRAAQDLVRRGWAQPVLLASHEAAQACASSHGLGTLAGVTCVDPADSAHHARWSEALRQVRPQASDDERLAMVRQPLYAAALMLNTGEADYCIAGNVSSTADVLRAGLRAVGLAKGNKTLSSVFFMLSPQADRVFAFGDCGVVPDPNAEQLADIAICAADNYRNVTGEAPHIALLSFSTRDSAKHPSIDVVKQALGLVRQRRPDLDVDGEMQFDAALVEDIGQRKARGSSVAGKANVFIFPNLAAGNIGYKMAERLGGYTALGPMIQGLARPLHDLSRGCSAEDMVQATVLAMVMNPMGS